LLALFDAGAVKGILRNLSHGMAAKADYRKLDRKRTSSPLARQVDLVIQPYLLWL
jgi:hypothetical protein